MDPILSDLMKLLDVDATPPLLKEGEVQEPEVLAYLVGPDDGSLPCIPRRTLAIIAVSHELLRRRVQELEQQLGRRV